MISLHNIMKCVQLGQLLIVAICLIRILSRKKIESGVPSLAPLRHSEAKERTKKKTAPLHSPAQSALSSCCICLSDETEDMLQLESCCHSIHMECAKGQLAAGWASKRISFGFMTCGECRVPLFHKKLKAVLTPHIMFKKHVENICFKKCLDDQALQGLNKNMVPSDPKNRSIVERCVDTMACFPCNACKQPFCAGRVDCAEDEALDVSTLNCESCAFEVQKQAQKKFEGDWRGKCLKHGYKYAMYKCDSCCSMATFDCRSNHYCGSCHNNAYVEKNHPCPGPELCPLGIEHPPNQTAVHGESRGEFINGFVVGCFKCFTRAGEDDPDPPDFMPAEAQWKDRF